MVVSGGVRGLADRLATFMSRVRVGLIAASAPLRRELDLWRWRRNFRHNVPAPIQDPRDPGRACSPGPLRVRRLSHAVGASPSRPTVAAPGIGFRVAGPNRPR